VTADPDDDRIVDEVHWTALRTIRTEEPIALGGLARTAVRIKASDELAGVVDQLNGIVGSILPDWDAATQSWIPRPALYRRPQVLVLDDGTAHLDVATERLINQRLRTLNLTRISVAHRPEMMSGADRIVRIDGNTVTELPARLPADPPAVT
jgi:hypothetical protein